MKQISIDDAEIVINSAGDDLWGYFFPTDAEPFAVQETTGMGTTVWLFDDMSEALNVAAEQLEELLDHGAPEKDDEGRLLNYMPFYYQDWDPEDIPPTAYGMGDDFASILTAFAVHMVKGQGPYTQEWSVTGKDDGLDMTLVGRWSLEGYVVDGYEEPAMLPSLDFFLRANSGIALVKKLRRALTAAREEAEELING